MGSWCEEGDLHCEEADLRTWRRAGAQPCTRHVKRYARRCAHEAQAQHEACITITPHNTSTSTLEYHPMQVVLFILKVQAMGLCAPPPHNNRFLV